MSDPLLEPGKPGSGASAGNTELYLGSKTTDSGSKRPSAVPGTIGEFEALSGCSSQHEKVIMKQNQFDKATLVDCGHGRHFAGAMRLPIDEMLLLDRITHISDSDGAHGKGSLVAEFDIHPDLWFFRCHFDSDPVMPGSLGLDALWQLIGFFLAWTGGQGKGRALGCGEVKFFGQVLPDNKLVRYHLDIKRVIQRKLTMAVADGRLEVDGREIYTARDLKVGLFESTDNF